MLPPILVLIVLLWSSESIPHRFAGTEFSIVENVGFVTPAITVVRLNGPCSLVLYSNKVHDTSPSLIGSGVFGVIVNSEGKTIYAPFPVRSSWDGIVIDKPSADMMHKQDPKHDWVVVTYHREDTPGDLLDVYFRILDIEYKTKEKNTIDNVQVGVTESRVNNMILEKDQHYSKVSALQNGGFVVVFEGRSLSGEVQAKRDVFMRFYDESGSPVNVNENVVNVERDDENQLAADVRQLNGSNVIVSYGSYGAPTEEASLGVFYRIYWEIGGLYDPNAHRANTELSHNQKNSKILSLENGEYFIYYDSYYSTPLGKKSIIKTQHFQEDGSKKGNEIQIPDKIEDNANVLNPSPIELPKGISANSVLISYYKQNIKNVEIYDYYYLIHDFSGKILLKGVRISNKKKELNTPDLNRISQQACLHDKNKVLFVYAYALGNGNCSIYGRLMEFKSDWIIDGQIFIIVSVLSFVVVAFLIVICIIFVLVVLLSICLFCRRVKNGNTEETKLINEEELKEIQLLELKEDERYLAFEKLQDFSDSFKTFKEKLFSENPFLIQNIFMIDPKDVKLDFFITQNVYKGTWKGLDVAYKSFALGPGVESEDLTHTELQQFGKEMSVYLRLNGLYGFMLLPRKVGLLCEYCRHGDLKSFLTRNPYVSMKKRIEICYGIVAGIKFLHERKIIHRDVKPENVLIGGRDIIPKIMDYGLSLVVSTTISHHTIGIGTIAYASPEQLTGDGVYNEKTDIFSLSFVFYGLLNGDFNVFGENKYDNKNVNVKMKNDDKFRPDLSKLKLGEYKWIKSVIEKCWKTDPGERMDAEDICNIFERNGVKCGDDNFVPKKDMTVYLKRKDEDDENLEDFELKIFSMEGVKKIIEEKWKDLKEYRILLRKKDEFIELKEDEDVVKIENDDTICVENK